MREIILDTETTGLDPKSGHRIVEIACVEIFNRRPTGKYFHSYINPERDVPAEAERVHGLSTHFLKSHPLFEEVADPALDFIADSPLVIHNAPFDLKFLHAEYGKLSKVVFQDHKIIDTLDLARRQFPKQPNSLDALCKRFSIDLSARDKHGALLDCELLARVYFELLGGAQRSLNLGTNIIQTKQNQTHPKHNREKRSFPPSQDEILAHNELIGSFKDPLWKKIS
jgi:DNA polymerase-3 subunit epsilon